MAFPPGPLGAQPEIGVFPAVQIPGVEAAQLLEQTRTDQTAGGGDQPHLPRLVDDRMIARQSGVDVMWIAVFGDAHPGMLDGPIREEQLRPDNAGFRMLSCVARQRLGPTRLRQGVVVEKDQALPICRRRPSVTGSAEADIWRQPDRTDATCRVPLEQ